MTKEEFFNIINEYQLANKSLDELGHVSNLPLFELSFVQHYETVFSYILKSEFTEDGVEAVYNWLYEETTDDLETIWNNILNDCRRN